MPQQLLVHLSHPRCLTLKTSDTDAHLDSTETELIFVCFHIFKQNPQVAKGKQWSLQAAEMAWVYSAPIYRCLQYLQAWDIKASESEN